MNISPDLPREGSEKKSGVPLEETKALERVRCVHLLPDTG